MGTLTAECPRLDIHCLHKLPTSCRLTSTPNCCACADERPHSRTYRVYIDGVGFVQRGTRWQGYCWFCKEFWNSRIACTYPPLEISQTRIPHIPDQTEFVNRWFEFHQGYRTVRRADGSDDRIAVIGEPLKEVSPGLLPRTLDQLRVGTPNDTTLSQNRFLRERLPEEAREDVPEQSVEDALDDLLEQASDDESDRREETGGEGELATAQMSAQQESTSLLQPPTRTDSHRQRALERLVRVFGTREEIQQDDYVSPITTMYDRAYDRFRQAEEIRASGATYIPPLGSTLAQARLEAEQQILWSVIQPARSVTPTEQTAHARSHTPRSTSPERRTPGEQNTFISPTTSAPPSDSITSTTQAASDSQPRTFSDIRPIAVDILDGIERLRQVSETISTALQVSPPVTLDNQPNRPEPMTQEQMTRKVECQVCYQQLADIAVLPCGHMVMCEYCADVVVPVKSGHFPIKMSKCPMCRKQVKQRFKIHF